MSPKASKHEYRGDVKDVRIVAELDPHSIYDRLWQPYVANLGNGHLVTVYGAQFRGKQDMGDLYASVSKDGGDTWQHPVYVFDHRCPVGTRRYGYLNPSLVRPEGTDTLWCFATRAPMYKRTGDDNELAAAYSVDGGWSWQEVPLACDFWSPVITCNAPVPVERDGRTRYLMPVHRGPFTRGDRQSDMKAFLLESGDLLHWRMGAYSPFRDDDPVFLAEGSLAERKDGTLTLVYRAAKYIHPLLHPTDGDCAYRCDSADRGRTWTEARPEPGCHNTWSKAWYHIEEDGGEVYIYSPGKPGERPGLDWVYRAPGDASWSKPRVFYDGENRNSYPTLAARDDGGWHAVWDSSKDMTRIRTRICFGTFDTHA
jgi:hypothetical protein